MKYVTCFGGIWRMTERNYLRYLKAGAADQDPDLDAYGKCIGVIAFNVTDAKPEHYRERLEIETRKD